MFSLRNGEQANENLQRLASKPFHVYLWIVIILTLLGNCIVLLWRLGSPRSQRFSAMSIIIINLAVADFVWGLHLIFVESALVDKVFVTSSTERSHNVSTIPVNPQLCDATYFLSCASSTAQTAALASIAGYSLLSLNVSFTRGTLCKMIFVVGNVVSQWLLALVLAWYSGIYSVSRMPPSWTPTVNSTVSPREVEIYYVLTQCSYSGSLSSNLESVVTVQLVLVSIATVCYIAFMMKVVCNYVRGRYQRQERRNDHTRILMIRLCVIVAINLLCWCPPNILYYFGRESIDNVDKLLKDTYCRIITEVTVTLATIPPALNPLIYTIVTKQFMRKLKQACCSSACCELRNNDRRLPDISETTTLIDEHNRPVAEQS